jgi:hypothetical protein
VAYAGGPLVSLLMFHYLGDQWTTQDCVYVIFVGLFLSIIPSILCFFFDDKKALRKPLPPRPPQSAGCL